MQQIKRKEKYMKENYRYIFDMDGTLYRFQQSKDGTFAGSKFYADIKQKAYQFLAETLSISLAQAQQEYNRIKDAYNGEVSLGFEKEYNIDRYDYFAQTWNANPKDYMTKNEELRLALLPFEGRAAVLSSAPRVWVQAVLTYLGVQETFGERIFTGEPTLRKPNPKVFELVAQTLESNPQQTFSIGDQEYSDIAPAQLLGMKTVLIGTPKETAPDFMAPDAIAAIALLQEKGYI